MKTHPSPVKRLKAEAMKNFSASKQASGIGQECQELSTRLGIFGRSITGLFLLFLLVSQSLSGMNRSKLISEDNSESLGLLGELILIKVSSENLALSVMHDTSLTGDRKVKFVSQYNVTKTLLDQFVIQLIADSKRRNRLKYYDKLDALLLSKKREELTGKEFGRNKKLNAYALSLKKLSHQFAILEVKYNNPLNGVAVESFDSLKLVNGAMIEQALGVAEFVSASIELVLEAREKRASSITEILSSARMKSLQELLDETPDKKDSEKKK